jgi:hypothetical protein
MRALVFILIPVILLAGCSKEEFDISNPDIKDFVARLKDGTYNRYETGENGEKLWAVFPIFNRSHIPLLIEMADDTTIVSPCDHFPVNSISSIPPYRIGKNGNSGIMIGEYLLWCAEAAIRGHFVSLVPVIANCDNPEKALSGREILSIRERYRIWWENYGSKGDVSVLPLSGTVYRWR